MTATTTNAHQDPDQIFKLSFVVFISLVCRNFVSSDPIYQFQTVLTSYGTSHSYENLGAEQLLTKFLLLVSKF